MLAAILAGLIRLPEMRKSIYFIFLSATLLLSTCAPKSVMNEKGSKKTFQPILQFMDYQSGMTFADVGAGSGALTVAMATLMDKSTIYIQDIDSSILKKEYIDKAIDDFKKQSGRDLRMNNKFIITIGTLKKTNLPDNTFNLIYSNATVHCFSSLDSMSIDLGRKLKTNGVLFFRDGFKKNQDVESYCSDPKCRRPLLTMDKFLTTMKRNGFELKKQSPNISGYPILGFTWTKNGN